MAADERRSTPMKTRILSAFISVHRRLIVISSQLLRERWISAWPANAPTQRVPRSRLRLGFHVRPLPCRALPALLPGNRNQGQIAGGVPGVLDGGAVAQGCLNEAIQAVVGVGGAGVRGKAGTDQGEQAAGGGLGVAGGIGGGDAEDRGAGGRDAGGEAPVVGLQGAAERGEGVGEGLAAVGGERDGLGGHADVIVGQALR